jgi:hypothetical protein
MDHERLRITNIYADTEKTTKQKGKGRPKSGQQSKLLATARSEHEARDSQNFRTPPPSPRAAGAINSVPNKKRG